MMNATNAWRMMVLTYISLLASMLVGALMSLPEIPAAIVLWLTVSLPLFLFIPGLIKRSHYAASWLAYTTMLYFVVVIAFSQGSWLWIQASAIVVLFLSSMLFTRWQKAEDKQKDGSSSME